MISVVYFFIFFILLNSWSNSQNVFMSNENQMTVPVVISRDQIKQFQIQMLDAFRIERPSKDAHVPDEFVSRYMTSLYKFIGGKNAVTLNPTFSYLDKKTDINDFDFNKILSGSNEYDSIVGFVPKKVSAKTDLAKALGDNLAEIDFGNSDDSLIDESMKLVHAELYFAVENEIVPLTSIKAFSTRGENLVALNGEQVIRMNDTNLLAFNVTKIVENWISWPETERRLFLRILDSEDKTMPLDSLLNKIHVFGVGFLVEDDDDETISPNRSKREASENDIDEEEPEETPTASTFKPRPLDILTRPRIGRCRLMTLYIDFNDIGWGDFILAPTGFSTNYCDGGCSFPLDVSLNPSNHATVQTLVHLIDKNKTSEALCAPISMDSPVSFLLLADNRVIIKKYSEMTVTNCGCQ